MSGSCTIKQGRSGRTPRTQRIWVLVGIKLRNATVAVDAAVVKELVQAIVPGMQVPASTRVCLLRCLKLLLRRLKVAEAWPYGSRIRQKGFTRATSIDVIEVSSTLPLFDEALRRSDRTCFRTDRSHVPGFATQLVRQVRLRTRMVRRGLGTHQGFHHVPSHHRSIRKSVSYPRRDHLPHSQIATTHMGRRRTPLPIEQTKLSGSAKLMRRRCDSYRQWRIAMSVLKDFGRCDV